MTLLPQTELNDLVDRYATLRDTIQGLEDEKEALGREIRAALEAGQSASCDFYRAELRPSRSTSYPADRFRVVFGDAATLEVATIDKKKADALVKAGDLDGQQLAQLAVHTPRTPSLVLTAI